MDIYRAQELAQRGGFDSIEFIAHFPIGPKRCKWLDAYFGFFECEGIDDGFLRVREIDDIFPGLRIEQPAPPKATTP